MTGYRLVSEGPLETARLQVHHIRTRPLRASAGRILFLGGSNFDLRLKRGFLDSPLCRRFDLAAYEPRGIGKTERPPGPWTMTDYALDALACLDALGWDRAHILGESFGGMTALHLALAQPDRVTALALAAATAGGACGASFDISRFLSYSRRAAAEAALVLQDTAFDAARALAPERFQAALAERIAFEEAFYRPSISSGGYAALLAARAEHDVCSALGRIAAPTLVCAGERDRQAPPDAQERMAAALPNARFELFDGGHGLLFNTMMVSETVSRHFEGAGRQTEGYEPP